MIDYGTLCYWTDGCVQHGYVIHYRLMLSADYKNETCIEDESCVEVTTLWHSLRCIPEEVCVNVYFIAAVHSTSKYRRLLRIVDSRGNVNDHFFKPVKTTEMVTKNAPATEYPLGISLNQTTCQMNANTMSVVRAIATGPASSNCNEMVNRI